MDKFGIIGCPIAHSLSPRLFRAAYGGEFEYDLIETASFEEAWQRFLDGYKAINVTAPFKVDAFQKADFKSPECLKTGATNLCIKAADGVHAYNSDYLGVKSILDELPKGTAAVIGWGGAGKAAFEAAKDAGFRTTLFRHDGIADGVEADVIVFTLPRAVEGIDKLRCRTLLEANYKDPCLRGHEGYIPGTEWHFRQALLGYGLMSGKEPDPEAMREVYL